MHFDFDGFDANEADIPSEMYKSPQSINENDWLNASFAICINWIFAIGLECILIIGVMSVVSVELAI